MLDARAQIGGSWPNVLEAIFVIAALRSFRTSKLADVIVLGLWIGVWALVLGGMEISTALRLRSYVQHHPELAA